MLDAVLGFRLDYFEHQLAHSVRDLNGRVYSRIPHPSERCNLMQAWAYYLDRLKAKAEIIQMHRNA